MRSRAYRRHKAATKQRRRLNDLHPNIREWVGDDPRIAARYKEQPKLCSCYMCGHTRKHEGPTIQERRHNPRR